MRTLVVGRGWLGQILAKAYGVDLFERRLEDLRHADVMGYAHVINAAAKTNIDWCERNKASAFASNVTGAIQAAQVCKQAGVGHVFISSACIFESVDVGDVRFEDADPNPKCFYSLTKWMAEEMVADACPNALIPRIRLPLSSVPHPRNTITKILSYERLVDTKESVTVIEDFVPALMGLMEHEIAGRVHLVNSGLTSAAEIATAFGKTFKAFTKKGFRDQMVLDGRARRVSTIVSSNIVPPLPNITARLPEIVAQYNQALAGA